MKICFFGSYKKSNYNLLFKKILELQGVQVIECREEISKTSSFFLANLKLILKHRKLSYDAMLIPWWGIITLPLAKIISKKPIIYVAFISIYDTLVNDRKKVNSNSLKAKLLHFVDKMSCRLSDQIIFESASLVDYYINEFHADPKKCRVLFAGADEEQFVPIFFKPQEKTFNVLFFGTFIPLHGVDVIVEAAKILANHKDIVFRFCGDGQMKNSLEKRSQKHNLTNIEFLGFVDKKILLKNIQESDVCLGIFGTTEKASQVVTSKVIQILASQKPLISRDSDPIREIGLKNGENCILIPKNDPQELANAILDFKNNPKKRQEVSIAGYQLYKNYLSMEKSGKKLLQYISELV